MADKFIFSEKATKFFEILNIQISKSSGEYPIKSVGQAVNTIRHKVVLFIGITSLLVKRETLNI